MIQKYKETFEADAFISQKNKYKEFNKKAQAFIAQYKEEKSREPQIKPPEKFETLTKHKSLHSSFSNFNNEDFNFDLASFIASVAEEAMLKDIVRRH